MLPASCCLSLTLPLGTAGAAGPPGLGRASPCPCQLDRLKWFFQGRPSGSPDISALVVGGAAGAQKVAASLLQVPVEHLQNFVALASWPQT